VTADSNDPPSPDKKPVVIHTRVNEDLDAEIRRRAQGLGVSVSNLVRNVLQHTFGLVGDIVADSKNVARSATLGVVVGSPPAPATAAAGAATAPVLGWQEAVLAVNAVCAQCNALLPKGTAAAIAVPAGNAFLCRTCLKELTHESGE
jgi:hypothetical protein